MGTREINQKFNWNFNQKSEAKSRLHGLREDGWII